jgi:predicted MFS family arabinose efflux permease
VPETSDPTAPPGIDVAGATLGALALGGVTYFLIEVPERGASAPILLAGIVGVAGAIGFVATERRSRHPLLPLDIFASRQFTGANVTTFSVYAALGGMFFLLGTYLQTALGYSPVEAGVALFPVTVLMLLLSERAGALATRIGPRRPMTFGPLVVAVALLLMARIEPGTSYVTTVLPAAVVFGLGLSLTVAPLTATVLAAADVRHSGVASGVNNAVARAAQLLAVAVLPAAAGITGDDYRDPAAFADGFRTAAFITATLSVLGGLTSWLAISDDVLATPEEEEAVAAGRIGTAGHFHCGADAPPLRRHHRRAA